MLEVDQRFNNKKFTIWKQKMLVIFEYRCLHKIVFGKEVWSTVDLEALDKHASDANWKPSHENCVATLNITFGDVDLTFRQLSNNLISFYKDTWKKQFGSSNVNGLSEATETDQGQRQAWKWQQERRNKLM